ncbi:hypothetical protein ZWY2020_052278 [Hordeum vulgare]|nr:hypothetical protein ZWY2020_052278 [Hordeum vulgare]
MQHFPLSSQPWPSSGGARVCSAAPRPLVSGADVSVYDRALELPPHRTSASPPTPQSPPYLAVPVLPRRDVAFPSSPPVPSDWVFSTGIFFEVIEAILIDKLNSGLAKVYTASDLFLKRKLCIAPVLCG